LVVPDLHRKARRRVAVKVNGRDVKVVTTGGEHSPDLVDALLCWRAWWALRHVVPVECDKRTATNRLAGESATSQLNAGM
jgi:hypothetical protein